MKRPFWMHQLVEYIFGIALVSMALHAQNPAIMVVAGVALQLNAASSRGPLSAFPRVPRAVHRVIDIVLAVGLVVAALLAGDALSSSDKFVMIGVALAFGFVVWNTNYVEKPKRAPVSATSGRSEEVGRMAGRAAGTTVNTVRALWKQRKDGAE